MVMPSIALTRKKMIMWGMNGIPFRTPTSERVQKYQSIQANKPQKIVKPKRTIPGVKLDFMV